MILRVVMYVMANVFMALRLKSIQFQLIVPPPYFRREQIWPEGEGGQLVGITDSSAWAENPSKEECSRRGTVVT